MHVVACTDSRGVGGAEISLANLVAEVDPGVRVDVLGVDDTVVARVAAGRPGTRAIVAPPRGTRRCSPGCGRTSSTPTSPCRGRARSTSPPRWRCRAAGSSPCSSSRCGRSRCRSGCAPAPSCAASTPTSPSARRAVVAWRTSTGWDATWSFGPQLRAGRSRSRLSRRGRTGPRWSGSLGRLDAVKGYDVLLRALARLPGVRAVVLGEGAARAGARASVAISACRTASLSGWSDGPPSAPRVRRVLSAVAVGGVPAVDRRGDARRAAGGRDARRQRRRAGGRRETGIWWSATTSTAWSRRWSAARRRAAGGSGRRAAGGRGSVVHRRAHGARLRRNCGRRSSPGGARHACARRPAPVSLAGRRCPEPAGPPSPGTAGSPGADPLIALPRSRSVGASRKGAVPITRSQARSSLAWLPGFVLLSAFWGFQLRADQDRAGGRRRAALGRLRPVRRRRGDARGDLRRHPQPAAARPVDLGARRRRRRARQHRAVRAAGLRRAARRLGAGRAAQRDHPSDDPAVRHAAGAHRADHRPPGRRVADRVRGRAVRPRGVARRRRRNHHGDPRLSRVDRLRRHVRLHAALPRFGRSASAAALLGRPSSSARAPSSASSPPPWRDCRPGPVARLAVALLAVWARSGRVGPTCSTSGSSARPGPPSPPRSPTSSRCGRTIGAVLLAEPVGWNTVVGGVLVVAGVVVTRLPERP